MRTFGRIILPALAASLSFTSQLGGPPTAKEKVQLENRDKIFTNALRCTRSLIDFHLFAQFKCHTSVSLKKMQNCLAEFHETKSVFAEFHGLKSTAVASKIAVQCIRNDTEGSTSHRGGDERGLSGLAAKTILNKRRKDGVDIRRKEWDAMEDAVQKTAHFNFPKAHIPVHYKGHVEWLGTLGGFSTEAGESAHKRQVKEGYNHSN